MAARIDIDDTLDHMEDEILYTRAALAADPDASDLLASTDDWLAQVDAARERDRAARVAVSEASASRRVANGRLDAACVGFGDALYLAAGKDRAAARWTRFFRGATSTASRFVRQPLRDEVAAVRAWLGVTGDDVLDAHRAELERWATAAQQALERTDATATARGEARVAREELADALTRQRDGLEAELVGRGQDRGLARDWPAVFFRTQRRSRGAPEAPPTPE
jgi:hypothetical protein